MLKLLVFFNLFLFVPSCAFASWPCFQANIQRNGQGDEEGPSGGGIRWQFEGIDIDSSVVVGGDGTIYAIGKNTLYALDTNGKEIWRYIYEEGRLTQPALDREGTIYIPAITHDRRTYLLAIDAVGGKKRWQAMISEDALITWFPHVGVDEDGNIYIYMTGMDVLSKFAPDGKKEWSYIFPFTERGRFKIAPQPTAPSLSPDVKTVYVYLRNAGGLYAFKADGTLKWRDPSPYTTDLVSPAVDGDGNIYISDAKSETIYKINPDGKKILSIPFPDKCLITAHVSIGSDGTLYAPIANDCDGGGGAIYALDPEKGKEIWSFAISKAYLSSAVAVDKKGKLYIADSNGNIYCLRPDGKLSWKHALAKSLGKERVEVFGSSPVIANNTLYIVTQDGTLLAIGSP